MSTRCSRCGLAIRVPTGFCPACGIEFPTIQEERKVNASANYYEALTLSPTASSELIRKKLKEAYRLWSKRANNSPTVELRYEAERKVLLFQEAEAILLNPAKRQAYDLTLRKGSQRASPDGRPLPTPTRRRTSAAAATTTQPSVVEHAAESPQLGAGTDLWHFLGWRVLKGTIIQVDPPYMGHPDFAWAGMLIKATLIIIAVIFIGPIVIGVLMGLAVVALIFAFLFPSSSAHSNGCLTSLASQMVGFFLTKRMFGVKPDIPVRDFRLRDEEGQEHLVRLKGELISGNLGVGDEVELEGIDRRGTFSLRRGVNKRTRSEIRVRHR